MTDALLIFLNIVLFIVLVVVWIEATVKGSARRHYPFLCAVIFIVRAVFGEDMETLYAIPTSCALGAGIFLIVLMLRYAPALFFLRESRMDLLYDEVDRYQKEGKRPCLVFQESGPPYVISDYAGRDANAMFVVRNGKIGVYSTIHVRPIRIV